MEMSYLTRKKLTNKRINQQRIMKNITERGLEQKLKEENLNYIKDLVRHSTEYKYEMEGRSYYRCKICDSDITYGHRKRHYVTYHNHDLKEYKIGK